MSVDACVASRSSELLTFFVGNMLIVLDVLFGEPEVNDVQNMGVLASAHQKVVGLDVSVEDVFFVKDFDSIDHLLSNLQDCLQGELFAVFYEEIFKTGAK